jgi:protein disulfide-isomerase-like protein
MMTKKQDNNSSKLSRTQSRKKGNSQKHKFVLYYAPWCGHCQKFKPIWDQFAEQINSSDKNISVSKVNCEENKCENISGYPTVIMHKSDGTSETYTGERTQEGLMAFIENY